MSIKTITSTPVMVGDPWKPFQRNEGIESAQDILVGEPWSTLKSESAADNSNTIMVGEPWGSLKKSSTDSASSIMVGDGWAMFSRKKSSDGSGGAPAAVAKFNPGRIQEPEMRTLRVRAELDAKLNSQKRSKVSNWIEAEQNTSKRRNRREMPQFGNANTFFRSQAINNNQCLSAAAAL